VFAHEYCGDAESWRAQASALAGRYRCLVFDARGVPSSDAPSSPDAYSQALAVEDAVALLDHLDIDRAHLVGLSMGAMTMLHLALRAPERVRSLLLAGAGPGHCASVKARFDAEAVALAKRISTRGFAALIEHLRRAPDRRLLERKNPAAWDELLGRLARRPASALAAMLERVVAGRPLLASLEPELRGLAVPVGIAVGDEDLDCLETARYLERTLPRAALSLFAGSGHTLNLEEPSRFNRMLAEQLGAVDENRWGDRDARSPLRAR